MSNFRFPLGIWGDVAITDDRDNQIQRVRIDRSMPSGFILITKERSGTFDVWLETEAEVEEFLDSKAIVWGEKT